MTVACESFTGRRRIFAHVAAGFLLVALFLTAPALAVASTAEVTAAQIDGITVRLTALEKDADTDKRLAALQKEVDDLETRVSQGSGPQPNPEAWRTLSVVGVAFAIAWALVSAAREAVRWKEVVQPTQPTQSIADAQAVGAATDARTDAVIKMVKDLLEAAKPGAKP